MKRIAFPLMAMVAAVFMLSGCSEKARVLTTYYTVHNDEWISNKDDNGNILYYYIPCRNGNMDDEAYENGTVTAFLITSDGDKPLPYTIYNAVDTDDDGTVDTYYEDHISYDIQRNGITFILESSDFNVSNTLQNTGQLQFKVCVIRNF